ncbi:MAG: hypothetical protein HY824_02025 [Acidobacteria bacterium]|nr:hypothetical protein [Acidobacteriota bacterium]
MNHQPLPDVAAEATTSNGAPSVHVKIGTSDVELNVWMSHTEVARLADVSAARWLKTSIRLGEVAGAPAWWSVDMESQTLSVLVGMDDETWDIGVTLPIGTLDVIVAAVASALVWEDIP